MGADGYDPKDPFYTSEEHALLTEKKQLKADWTALHWRPLGSGATAYEQRLQDVIDLLTREIGLLERERSAMQARLAEARRQRGQSQQS